MKSKRLEITYIERGKTITVDAVMSNFGDDWTLDEMRSHYEKEHPNQKVTNFVERGVVAGKDIKQITESINAGQPPANPYIEKSA